MKKTLLSVAVLSAGFGLVGCNEVDKNGDLCSYYVKQDMNTQQFDSAISRLQTQSCQDSYVDDGHLVDLGAAYMGRAGSSLLDIISVTIDIEEDDSSEDSSDQFASFVTLMKEKKTATTLVDLKLAADNFQTYLYEYQNTGINESTVNSVTLFHGFANVVKTSSAIDSLLGGNLDAWIDKENNADDKTLERASCALETIYMSSTNSCDGLMVSDKLVSVTFDNNITYQLLTVSDASGEFDQFLQKGIEVDQNTTYTMVMTDGYCYTDFSEGERNDEGVFPCPVNRGVGEDLDMEEFLVDAVNEGFDSILEVVDGSDQDKDGEIKDAIEEFKREITADKADQTADITLDDIIHYLNNPEVDSK